MRKVSRFIATALAIMVLTLCGCNNAEKTATKKATDFETTYSFNGVSLTAKNSYIAATGIRFCKQQHLQQYCDRYGQVKNNLQTFVFDSCAKKPDSKRSQNGHAQKRTTKIWRGKPELLAIISHEAEKHSIFSQNKFFRKIAIETEKCNIQKNKKSPNNQICSGK